MDKELSLSSLFSRALSAAARASNMPTIQDETQELIQSALTDLRLVQYRVTLLSLFSPNETLHDITTRDLVYLFVPFVLAETENRVRTTDPRDRLERIGRAQASLREFVARLEAYQIVPEAERELWQKRASAVVDPARRRELKIKQYQKEKELKARVETIRKRRKQAATVAEPNSDFELIASLLPDPDSSAPDDDDSETEDIIRETITTLLLLEYAQAQGQLESMDQELELLRSMPPPPPPQQDTGKGKEKAEDDMWKLDAPRPSGGPDGKGPVLDASGKPLRPFTILPAGANDRARLQAQVFAPDHRLPTMTVDEYLEIERQRGYMISGGGPKSEEKLTTSEQLQLDSEMDGTAFAEEREEAKRQKDENWAQYTDANPRGAGNMMNRG